MIEILIASHAMLAEGVLSAAELIMGKQEHVTTLALEAEDSFESFGDRVLEAITELNNEDGILVFVDLFGGTPCNVTVANTNKEIDGKKPKYEAIAGVNLPLLIEALSMREAMEITELKNHLMATAADGIKDIKVEFDLD